MNKRYQRWTNTQSEIKDMERPKNETSGELCKKRQSGKYTGVRLRALGGSSRQRWIVVYICASGTSFTTINRGAKL